MSLVVNLSGGGGEEETRRDLHFVGLLSWMAVVPLLGRWRDRRTGREACRKHMLIFDMLTVYLHWREMSGTYAGVSI